MSMLTPPGMGGKYRITGNRFPHMRRPRNRRRIVLAVVSAAAVLGLAGWGTLQLAEVFSGGGSRTEAAAHRSSGDCKNAGRTAGHRVPLELPRPSDITVNVYNATPRGGLAKITADELERRGFKIGKVGNAQAEYDKKVPGPGLLMGGPGAAEGALRVLGTQLAGAETRSDQREGQDVDLVLGDAYKALTAKEDADRLLAGLTAPVSSAPPTPSAVASTASASAPAKC
ncbi:MULTISPECIES: LytR C-terminal domain-containing protein [Streptomyces]|uniref:LytR C-terminal domain-containing protein n=1 Tax=Streptomyces morookaense TaxID=1970 RepID=A0A7Y7B549_STRMO|nr:MULTISPECIES: LytR C-terminal domain-containing protein [Streptomyces]MCC2274831.1 LytR C-terminal domain-containing protein [Streptomyces sp. ET3-23]NVK79206.1 LytR C-terminal domain-containing protein [Streptomyces morookaense]GHF27759.1 membrane protein [Streptomyces morookaense]